MNRLILIGNGFDLAHGMKTSYNDFMLWYLSNCVKLAKTSNYVDELIEVTKTSYYDYFRFFNDSAVDEYIRIHYQSNFETLSPKLRVRSSQFAYQSEPFIFNIKSRLLEVLLKNYSSTTWVDIETEFYDQLTQILNTATTFLHKQQYLEVLNKSLSFVIEKLEQYLSQLSPASYDPRYGEIFSSTLKKFEILLPWSEGPQWRSEWRF